MPIHLPADDGGSAGTNDPNGIMPPVEGSTALHLLGWRLAQVSLDVDEHAIADIYKPAQRSMVTT